MGTGSFLLLGVLRVSLCALRSNTAYGEVYAEAPRNAENAELKLRRHQRIDTEERFAGKMSGRQKERALTSPKTSALAFISVLPWRINDAADTTGV